VSDTPKQAELRKLLEEIAARTREGGHLPYFKFYPQDFYFSTRAFSREERSVYLELIVHEWGSRSLPGSLVEIADLLDMKPEKFERMWQRKLRKKFVELDGSYYNLRIERVRREAFGNWTPAQSTTTASADPFG
jgi:hypothetical protein